MKLIIIRHAEPDYAIDGLTEKGKKEAELLVPRLKKENIKKVYCSPLGRAKLTIEPTLKELGITAEYVDWLQEFSYAKVNLPYLTDRDQKACWDILPEYINKFAPDCYGDDWQNSPLVKNSNVAESYKSVTEEFDKMLERHGYRRDGKIYKAEFSNHDTIILQCHMGVSCILMSHLMNCSPFSLLQHCVTLPSAVSTFFTEERREGIAHFRACGIGDISHLYVADEEPSFAARFCECFSDDTRHD